MGCLEFFDINQSFCILIVDDVRINQELLVELLKPYYQTKVASNGSRALEIARDFPQPDLILLDVNMPNIDGHEVCQKLQENFHTRDIPVIFMTSSVDKTSETYGLQLGTVDYISKPFNPEVVLLRVRHQIVLKQSQNRLRLAASVFEHTMEAIMITDAKGNIACVNPAFTHITGYTAEEVRGKNPRIFKSGYQTPAFYQAMWHDITTKGHWQNEIWDKRKNGDIHAKFLNISTVFNKEGKVDCYIAFFSDITARKQYEEELKRLSESELNKAKLDAENANRAKSEFLASMSHELRTPMNAVLGFAQLLEMEELSADQRDSVHEILSAGHHLLNLINEVLDLAKIEAGKLDITLEKIDLNSIIHNCINLSKPLLSKNQLNFTNKPPDCPCAVIADPLQLKQVLLNLISNAIKYNRVNGNVDIACEVINKETIRIKITDSGEGLSELELSKLFQPFERLRAKNSAIEGTGIGLCISKKLIEAMNGRIGAESEEGVGSCFWIEIPLA